MRRRPGWFVLAAVPLLLVACNTGGGGTAPQIASFIESTHTSNDVVTSGAKATLAWSLSGGAATSVRIDHNVGAVTSGSSVDVHPARTTTYTLIVSNAAGADTATVTVKVGIDATAIAAYGAHALAIDTSSHALGWGFNNHGQVGDGTVTARDTAVAVDTSSLGTVQKVAAGRYFSLVLDQAGALWAFGENGAYELGNGGVGTESHSPVRVDTGTGLTAATAIGAGSFHGLAIDGSQAGWSWGHNYNGELGIGGQGSASSPASIYSGNVSAWAQLDGGEFFSLGVDASGNVWGWGDEGTDGAVGAGSGDVYAPMEVISSTSTSPNYGKITAVSAGFYHSLALAADGTVWAWGDNTYGQVGDPTAGHTTVLGPYHVLRSGLPSFTAVAAGGAHSLALAADGTVWAWGDNSVGELGNGGNVGSADPVQVTGVSGVTAIAAGNDFSLARESDGSVWAWGAGGQGQLGNGGTSNSAVPVQVLTTP